MSFLKLKDVNEFTVANISAPYWVSWDTSNAKYNRYKVPTEGAQQKWDVITPNRDRIPISRDQFGQMLIATANGTEASVKDKAYSVKTNGKEGMEIRYFLNLKS